MWCQRAIRATNTGCRDGISSLVDVLAAGDAAAPFVLCSGPVLVHRLRFASKTINIYLAIVLHLVAKECAGWIYVCGGFSCERVGTHEVSTAAASSAQCFTPSQGHWSVLPETPDATAGVAVAVLAGFLYVCGGRDRKNRDSIHNAVRLDPSSHTWENLQPMKNRRAFACAVACRGRIYVCGGCGETVSSMFNLSDGSVDLDQVSDDGREADYLNSAECFDPDQNTWHQLPAMVHPRAYSSVVILKEKLYIVGGQDDIEDSGRHLREPECIEPSGDSWATLPPMSVMRAGAAVIAMMGCLYVCGGCRQNQYHASVERFVTSTGFWEILAPMSIARGDAVAAVVANQLYVCGGEDGEKPFATVERYNHANNFWELLQAMWQPRSGAASATLSGKLYVFGGMGSDGYHSSAERYDPAAQSWEQLAAMNTGRAGLLAGVVQWA